ncbi:MAG TPA: diphthine--ammonia ligase [Methanocorpusculum sp.]|nr:diphthine--ammonia ligase [Methanocorpusculum sp.]
MKLVALTSGGKDSILSIQKALDEGHEVTHMVTVVPENHESYMFHSVNLAAVPIMAERGGMEYLEIPTKGEKEEEIRDMKHGMEDIVADGIIAGAIASEYQRSRVAAVCSELGMKCYVPLWGLSPDSVVGEVADRMDARIVVTAADGLNENVLGKRIDANLIRVLKAVEAKRRIHIAGEGGEYESLVFDAPFFSSPLHAEDPIVTYHGSVGIATYGRFW